MTRADQATAPGSGQAFMSTMELNRLKTLVASKGTGSSSSSSPIHGLDNFQQQVDAGREQQKMQLKQQSEERVKKWGNTIDGQRQRQLMARQIEAEEKEKKAQELDRQEAQYQEAIRQAIMDRAARTKLLEMDKVRSFNGRLLLSEVLEEREKQVQTKAAKAAQHQQEAEEHFEYLKSKWTEWDANEDRKHADAKQKIQQNREFQIKQLEERNERRAKEQAELDQEAAEIRRRAQEAVDEERERLEAKREAQRQMNIDTKVANQKLQQLRIEIAAKAAEEQKRIADYAKSKEDRDGLIRQKEQDRLAAQLAIRQRMIDAQATRLSAAQNQEETRLATQVKEEEERQAADEAARKQRQADLKAMIDRSRQIQMQQRDLKNAILQEERDGMQLQMRELNAELEREEQAEVMGRKKKAKSLQSYQRKQVAEKKLEREQQRLRAQLEAQEQFNKGDNGEKQFAAYVRDIYQKNPVSPKNARPMELMTKKRYPGSSAVAMASTAGSARKASP